MSTTLCYGPSFRLLHAYVSQYNQKQEALGDQVRGAMIATAKELIRLYGPAYQRGKYAATEQLPTLATNNAQLASLLQLSKATIKRHIKRLLEAGVLLAKQWHGSRADYELWLNPDLLVFREQQQREVKSTKRAHTDSGNIFHKLVTSAVDKWTSQQPPEPPPSAQEKAGNTRKEAPLPSKNALTAQEEVFRKAQKLETQHIAATRKEAPAQPVVKPFEGTAQQLAGLRLGYARQLWTQAKALLYAGRPLSEKQEAEALQLIARFYQPVAGHALAAIHAQYSKRLELAAAYVARDPGKRYIPLPFRYFDTRNPLGFCGTKVWYMQYQQRQQAKAQAKAVHVSIARVRYAVQQGEGALSCFKQEAQKLQQMGEPYLQRYYQQLSQGKASSLHKYISLPHQ